MCAMNMRAMCTMHAAYMRNVHNIWAQCPYHMCAMQATYARNVYIIWAQCPYDMRAIRATHVRNACSICARCAQCAQHMRAMCTTYVHNAHITCAQCTQCPQHICAMCTTYGRNAHITCAPRIPKQFAVYRDEERELAARQLLSQGDFGVVEVLKGDIIAMGSDGISDNLSTGAMKNIISERYFSGDGPKLIAEAIAGDALRAGLKPDDTTIIVAFLC